MTHCVMLSGILEQTGFLFFGGKILAILESIIFKKINLKICAYTIPL